MAIVKTVNNDTGSQTDLVTGLPTYPKGGVITYMYTTPGDFATTRKLYAIGNNEFWYESSAGVMAELDAANGDMDITTQLMSAEAYEKVFIANGTNLKVADFVNIRLTSETAISSNVPAFGSILTQATSGASIVVDLLYYDTTAEDHYVYGRNLDTGTWNTTNNVLDVDSNVIITGAGLSAVTTGPLWYDWVPYNTGQVTTFDGIPTNVQIICRYRGRVVVAGDTTDPNQWYMSRMGNPWDWAYTSLDAQSAVSGEAGEMGKSADIIKALIPYKDDYLIIGGEHTMSVMRGDPADSGSLDTIEETIGIFGSKSWCFDGEGNLYFWGTGGIYKMPYGFGRVLPISKNALPNLGGGSGEFDSPTPSTHSINMAYDVKRLGINIVVVNRSDGSHRGYFYDLRIGGFYPETYPEAGVSFSMLYYPSNDPNDSGMLMGCKDGYIRILDSSSADDIDADDENVLIESYVTLPIIKLGPEDREGVISEIVFETGGGGANNSFGDTDSMDYYLYIADSYEEALEKVIDGGTPTLSGTVSGSGRTRIRDRIRGAYAGILLFNDTESETWAINKIYADIKPVGKIR